MYKKNDKPKEQLISAGAARALTEQGITFISSTNKIILVHEATVIAELSKTGSRFLGPAISLLDTSSAQGMLRIQTRANIDRHYEETGDIVTTNQMRQLLSQDDHLGVALKLLEKERPYQNMHQLMNR